MLLSLAFLPSKVFASHAAGAEITYAWIADSTYQITYKFYRDCSGISEPTTVNICYFSTCGTTTYTINLPKASGPNGLEVGTGCPGWSSTCNGGTNPGYREWIYTGQVTLPYQCNYWKFFHAEGSRNQTDNLLNSSGQNLYVETTFNNLAAQGNSSPYFTVKPVPYMCINSPFTFNNGAVDPNGDSLSFEIMQPLGGGTCSAPSGGGSPISFSNTSLYNLNNNPLGTGNTFSINGNTGSISFTPNAVQKSVLTVLVKEWRNQQLIGTIMRDMQIIVLNCTSTQPTINTDSTTLTGVQLINGQVQGCATQPMNFCFDLKSSNPNAILVANDNHAISAPGSSVAYTGQTTDSIRACFSWIPTPADTGLKILTITVKDSTCTPPGILIQQTFTIPVYIWPYTVGGPDTSVCQGDSLHLHAVGGGNFVWTVLPGGSPITSLSCTNCKNPIAVPFQTTDYVVTSQGGNSFCNHNSDTVHVVVLPPPTFNLGPDTTTCIGNSLQLDVHLVPDPGQTYTINWTPSTYLNNSTIANPVTTPTNNITYVVKVTPGGIGVCGGYDTLNVKVLQGFTVFNHDTAICLGSSVQINAIGDTKYTYAWTPTIGVSNSAILNPLLTPSIVGPVVYTVTASFPGCTDSTHKIGIDVQPVPTVYVGPDQILCYGDTVHINSVITPSSYAYYTYSWNPNGGLSSPSIANPIFTANQTTTMVLSVTTPAGCLGTDDIKFDVVPAKFITVSNDVAICPRDTTQLHVVGTTIASVAWHPRVYISDSLSLDPYVWPAVTSNYTVIARDTNYCLDSATIRVVVLPDAVIHLPDSARIYPGESYQIDPSGNCLYFQWFPPLGLSAANIANPVAQPTVNTRYFVNAATEAGCIARDSIDILVSDESNIDVPNAFSPGSYPNATLMVVHNGAAVLKSFKIFNRWGVKVFETSDINEGWDGKFNGTPQPMGVYIYTVEAISPTGRKFTKQGNVTLIR